jgi:hypothetical protein
LSRQSLAVSRALSRQSLAVSRALFRQSLAVPHELCPGKASLSLTSFRPRQSLASIDVPHELLPTAKPR